MLNGQVHILLNILNNTFHYMFQKNKYYITNIQQHIYKNIFVQIKISW